MGLFEYVRDSIRSLTSGVAKSAGYQDKTSATRFWNFEERPPFCLFTIEQMELDPTATIALAIRDGLLSSIEVQVEGGPPAIREYVEKLYKDIWAAMSSQILRTKVAGFAGFELLYKKDADGRLAFTGFRDFNPRDLKPLIRNGEPVGMTVSNLRGLFVDPVTAQGSAVSRFAMFAPKSLWLTHKARYGSHYGRSVFESAYPPWYEKWMRGGATKLRQLRMVKDSWIGDVIKYPTRKTVLQNGTEIGYRDVADEIIGNRLAGGAIGLPSDRDSQGNALWEYIPPTSVQGASQIFDYVGQLDEEILNALKTPGEVIKAVEGGIGGVGGRSVPLISLFATLQAEFSEYLSQLDKQVLRNAVRLGFNCEPSYTISAKPLIKTMAAIMGGGEHDSAGDADGDGIPNGRDPQPYRPQPGRLFNPFGGSMGNSDQATETRGEQFSETKRPLAYKSATTRSPRKAGKTGSIVGGVYYRPGQWISGEAMQHATAEEVLQLSEFSKPEQFSEDSGARWITIGGRKDGSKDGSKDHKGGFPVQIGSDGTILKSGGPSALVGMKIDDVGSHFYRESLKRGNEQRKKNEAKYGKMRDIGDKGRRSYQDFAKASQEYFGISAEEYDNYSEEAWQADEQHTKAIEEARAAARQKTKFNAGKIRQLEKDGLDSATAKEFDVIARELASEYPSLGWGAGYEDQTSHGGSGRDLASELWDLIREGKTETPARNSEEFHQKVFDLIDYYHNQKSTYTQPDWVKEMEF